MGTTFTTEVEVLARFVDRDGLTAHESAIAALVLRARGMGLQGACLNVLGDRREPVVARQRALGMVGRLRRPAPASHVAA